MATGSAIPAAIDAVVAALTTALPGVLVVDGMGNTDSTATRILWVGLSDPDAIGPDDAATSEQKWANLGHATRDETLTINMVALAWNGDADQKLARDEVFGIFDAIANLVQTDPKLGGTIFTVTGFSSISLRQAETEDGVSAYLPFGITGRARLS